MADENLAGILTWANSIRGVLLEDPGRQLFEDQLQTYGFLFLDNYLDNILAGPKQENMIDLVKTPGRKKNVPKKTRSATAAAHKAKYVVSATFEDDEFSKENVAPLNNFHKALLEVKKQDDHQTDSTPLSPLGNNQSSRQLSQHPTDVNHQPGTIHISAIPPLQPHNTDDIEMAHEPMLTRTHERIHDAAEQQTLTPAPMETSELSVIAEDDESTERSRDSLRLSAAPGTQAVSPPTVEPASYSPKAEAMEVQKQQNVEEQPIFLPTQQTPDDAGATAAGTSSPALFQSISLDSPSRSTSAAVVTLDRQFLPANDPTRAEERNMTAPLPSRESLEAPAAEEAHTEPLPIFSSMDDITTSSTAQAMEVLIPLRDENPPHLNQKKSIPQFSTLPGPSPLRKSVRGTSMGTAVQVATPGAPSLGKRTSWLQKAREIKAMEATIVPQSSTNSGDTLIVLSSDNITENMPLAVKRKSDEMLTTEPEQVTTLPNGLGPSKIRKISNDRAAALEDDGRGIRSGDSNREHTSRFSLDRRQLSQEQRPMPPSEPEDMMDRFKRTVEDMGTRVGTAKNFSSALAVTTALAEARAAAEARVAERLGMVVDPVSVEHSKLPDEQRIEVEPRQVVQKKTSLRVSPSAEGTGSLTVSELVTTYEQGVLKGKAAEKSLAKGRTSSSPDGSQSADQSRTTTTPPNSPPPNLPPSLVLPSGPVFNKPPVFVPPASRNIPPTAPDRFAPVKNSAFQLPSSTVFSLLAPMPGTGPARPLSSKPKSSEDKQRAPLSSQSTLASMHSDVIFDKDDDVPAWMPSTQETEYSSVFNSQGGTHMNTQSMHDIDDDDSWPLEKVIDPEVPFSGKEDSLTWSTLPTESQRGDTGPVVTGVQQDDYMTQDRPDEDLVPRTPEMDLGDGFNDMGDEAVSIADERAVLKVSDLEVRSSSVVKSSAHVIPQSDEVARSQSQMSTSTMSSQQSQIGIFSQATKFVASVLGGGKKAKTEVKSLQLAAAAAKKEQEEKEKKAARLKEMENRRQLAIQRKKEEEDARAIEEDRKIREETERRKRDREEHTDKKVLRSAVKKGDEDNTKKRKIAVEAERSKMPPPKEKKEAASLRIGQPSLNASSNTGKFGKPTSALKQPSSTAGSSSTNAALHSVASSAKKGASEAMETKSIKSTTVTTMKTAATPKAHDTDAQPSNVIQSQMAARLKAQIQMTKQQPPAEPLVPSEAIELPDINSEYSDSEDEDRPRTFDPPDWAQSPELRQALQNQSTINPDDIFGSIRPLKMEEIFRTRQSRFRARTSSANWTGTDQLTTEEETSYARRMGFQ